MNATLLGTRIRLGQEEKSKLLIVVLDALTVKPVEGATIKVYAFGEGKPMAEVVTGPQGFRQFDLATPVGANVTVVIEHPWYVTVEMMLTTEYVDAVGARVMLMPKFPSDEGDGVGDGADAGAFVAGGIAALVGLWAVLNLMGQ